jgi:hypothetical protein
MPKYFNELKVPAWGKGIGLLHFVVMIIKFLLHMAEIGSSSQSPNLLMTRGLASFLGLASSKTRMERFESPRMKTL